MSNPKPTEPAEALISVRPKKNSALATLARQARAKGDRGAMSELFHGWADKHAKEASEAVEAATPPPDVGAFD